MAARASSICSIINRFHSFYLFVQCLLTTLQNLMENSLFLKFMKQIPAKLRSLSALRAKHKFNNHFSMVKNPFSVFE